MRERADRIVRHMQDFDEMRTSGHTIVFLILTYNQLLSEQDEMNKTENQKKKKKAKEIK